MEVCVPHSSTNTKRPGSRRLSPSCQRALSASSRSAAGRDFFERQPQTPEGAADAGDGDRHALLVVEELAVLLEGEVGVARDLRRQRLLQRPALARGRAGRRLGIDAARLSAQPQPRLTVGSETPKVSATSPRGIPRSTAASTLILRSFEYGFMTRVSHNDQRIRNPLLELRQHEVRRILIPRTPVNKGKREGRGC